MKLGTRLRIFSYQPAAVLRVSGEDAAAFLQGQFSQELRGGEGRAVRYGLWLNQKGKVIADSFVLRGSEGEWWLVSYFSAAAVIRERLEGYIIADDVSVEDVTAEWRAVAVVGEGAEQWIAAHYGSVPGEGGYAQSAAGVVFRGRRGVESFEWLMGVGSALPEAGGAGSPEELERWRIEGGVPAVGRDVGAGDLPNEAGLEVDGISYTKGCYLGQEVMARLKSMGQVRRRLVRVRAAGVAPGVLPLAVIAGEKRVGELRSVVATSEGFVGLAMVSLLGLEPETALRLEGGTGTSLRIEFKAS